MTTSAPQNLIYDGNFTSTNGFGSDYIYSADYKPGGWGTYDVFNRLWFLSLPNISWSQAFAPGAHMLVADGAALAGKRVWYETVNLVAGTTYDFSSSTLTDGGTVLQLSLNGQAVGTGYRLTNMDTVWTQSFTATTTGAAVLAITDLSTVKNGNDFAIDYLSLVARPTSSALLVNGNFEGTGTFQSDYYLLPQNNAANNILISGSEEITSTTSAVNYFGTGVKMAGHGGSGEFLLVNASNNLKANIWRESVNLVQGTTYTFTGWTFTTGNINLQLTLNGADVAGQNFTPYVLPPQQGFTSSPFDWQQFTFTFTATKSGSATIGLRDAVAPTIDNGQFGLDDLSLAPATNSASHLVQSLATFAPATSVTTSSTTTATHSATTTLVTVH